MTQNKQLRKLLALMDRNGFRHREKFGALLIEVYRLLRSPRFRAHRPALMRLRDWLVIPYSFWPCDFEGLTPYVCKTLIAGQHLDEKLQNAFHLLQDYPASLAQELVAANEHTVRLGQYRQFVRCNEKYEAYEAQILANQTLKLEWERLKALHDVERFLDRKRIVRRRMVCERNFKIGWEFRWDTDQEKFQLAFDAFCYRWNLYGMENDKPLLLKLTVNMTPFGTLIMIPSYMSPDFMRDINYPMITRIHKALGAGRHGTKLHEVRRQREDEARRTAAADKQARKRGLEGEDRRLFIIKKAELPPTTDPRRIRFLLSQAAKLPDRSSTLTPKSIETKIEIAPPATPIDPVEQAKAAVNALSAEEKQTLLKWLQ